MKLSIFILLLLPVSAGVWATEITLQNGNWKLPANGAVTEFLTIQSEQDVRLSLAEAAIPVASFRGGFAELCGEYRTNRLRKSGRHPHGGKINLQWRTPDGKRHYAPHSLPEGDCDWTAFRLVGAIPDNAVDLRVQAGLQQGRGQVAFRNVRVRRIGTSVSLANAANMEWQDEVAGDGRGGWTDAGRKDDGRFLRRMVQGRYLFNGYPFSVITAGRGVLAMRQKIHFPYGLAQADFSLPEPIRSRYLYLLHTASWMSRNIDAFGEIIVRYSGGKEQTFVLRNGVDLADWTHAAELKNSRIAVRAFSDRNPLVVLYASCFALDVSAGAVTGLTIRPRENAPIWLIAGITLSDENFTRAQADFEIRPGAEWRALSREPRNRRIAGSALDLNRFREDVPCGTFGRVVVNENGNFAFEKRPEQPVRFFTNTVMVGYLTRHEEIEEYVDELCKNGYNMLRLHYLDLTLSRHAKESAVPAPAWLDAFDYLVSRCKARGIYLNLDCMTSTNGYAPGEVWGRKNLVTCKSRIYFEPEIRAQWIRGVRTLLTRVNPYTGTRLAEDPVLAMAVGYNEQEFGFLRPQSTQALPAWRAFLKRRYGTIDALRRAWGKRAEKIRAWEEIPLYKAELSSFNDADFAEFVLENEREIMRFYRKELDKMGFRGPLSGFNLLGTKQSLLLRREFDYVSKNSYETLMSNYFNPGSILSQDSSISSLAKLFRTTVGTRLAGKPFFVTEYGIPFWNRYRYEVAFTMGAFAAFQRYDGVAAFGDSYARRKISIIQPVRIFQDPIGVAAEFLTFFLYMRGDVSPARGCVILDLPAATIMEDGRNRSLAQEDTVLGLMTRLECFVSSPGKRPPRPGLRIPARRGDRTGVSQLHATTLEDGGRERDPAGILRANRLLPPGNCSDGRTVFESDTGELYLDGSRRFMSVNTPRFQGVCAEAGTTADLRDLSILKMSRRGNLSLVSLDSEKSLRETGRMVLVCATNVLNSGMTFDSPEMRMMLKRGTAPALLETGVFRIRIRNVHAANLRLIPLDLSGARGTPVEPVAVTAEWAEFEFDTAKCGPALFFEITTMTEGEGK